MQPDDFEQPLVGSKAGAKDTHALGCLSCTTYPTLASLERQDGKNCYRRVKQGNIHVTRVQVVFASTEAFLSTTLELQETLRSKLKIPSFFFDRMYLQSSSFCGYDVWLDKNEEVEFYTYWARFTVKQTYDKLQPKRTFTPHISNHHNNPSEWNTDIAIHGPQSVRHG
ncbi:hypothetical protein GGP41_000438 [Bipolaris sorokiniana]|uniref:Uncharacterized protein n=1 Tax=Cochliobolus sativus TaxID=45130 RepID=A0A8H5ZMM7_COCSA|nr:hypothetical protein GGP41_000438 [Bipolaris sorokiniana]